MRFALTLVLLLVSTLLLTQTIANAQEQTYLQELEIQLHSQNYTILNTSRAPIHIGEPVSWKLLLTNNVQLFNVEYQTAPIMLKTSDLETTRYWEKEVLLETNHSYKNISFIINTPSTTNMTIDGNAKYTILSENSIELEVTSLQGEEKITLQGHFIDSLLERTLYAQNIKGTFSAKVKNAFLELFKIEEENMLLQLTGLKKQEQQNMVELTSPALLSEETKVYAETNLQSQIIPLPYTLSEDKKTIFIDWGLAYDLTPETQRSSIALHVELYYQETNQFILETDKDAYELGETVHLQTTPEEITGFFYFLDVDRNISLQKEKNYTPTKPGTYYVEASLYENNYSESHYLSFNVLENRSRNETNTTINMTIMNVTNETIILPKTIRINYTGYEQEVQTDLKIKTRPDLVKELQETTKQELPTGRVGTQDLITPRDNEEKITTELEKAHNYTFDLTIKPEHSHIKKIDFKQVIIKNQTLELGITNLNLTGFEKSFAIDPERAEFETAIVTVIATGNELYKCPSWNFQEQTCPENDWFLYKEDLVPGQEYTFEIGPKDPGFGEKIKSDSNQFLVQRGTASGATLQLTGTLTTAVNTSQSFLHFYPVTASATPDDWQFTGTLSSSTGVTFDRYNTVDADVYWEVVSSENLFVQRGEEILATNNATATITLPDSIDTSRSFVLVHGRCNSAGNTDTRAGFFSGELTDSTTLVLTRGNANLCEATVDWQVIEWLGATVQKGTTTIADNTDSATASINAVDLSKSILFFGYSMSGTDPGMDSNNVQGSFASTTQLTFTNEPGSTYASSQKDVVWYVVEAPELTVQSGTTTVDTLTAQPITALNNISRAFTSASWWSTGGGQTWGRGQSGVSITSTTNLNTYKGQSGQTNDIHWFVAEYGTFEKDYATIQLNNYPDDSGVHTVDQLDFNYTPTDATGIANCSLTVNGIIQDTDTSITNNTPQILSYTPSAIGKYDWNISCVEEGFSNLKTTTLTRSLHVFEADKFFSTGTITNLTQENVTNLNSLKIIDNAYGLLEFKESLNLSGGADLDSVITFTQDKLTINTLSETRLNVSAEISLYNLTQQTPPAILKDGTLCQSECTFLSYDQTIGNLTFNVTSFSTYEAINNSQLTIYDTSDSKLVLVGEQNNFYANYSNTTNNQPLNGTNFFCEFSHDALGSWSTPLNMTYNQATKLYETNSTFLQGDYEFNVSCKNTQNYENLTASDTFSVGQIADDPPTVELLHPINDALWVGSQINFTCSASDDKAVEQLELYANTSGVWKKEKTKNFTETVILNVTWGEDVLLSGEFPNDGEDAIGELTGQDYRVVEQFDLSSIPNDAQIASIEFRAYIDVISTSPNHRVSIHPYNNNISYNPQPDTATQTYDRINDGTAFTTEQDICSSGKTIGYSNWISLGNIATYYAKQTLATTNLYTLGLYETGENDGVCQLAEYTATNKQPQLRITYVPAGTTYETNFSVNETTLGTYAWNCKAVDTGNQSSFASTNRTINRVQSYNPMMVTLDDPTGGEQINSSTNVPFNISVSDDDGLANCTLWTDKSGLWNPTTTKTLTGISNQTTWYLTGFTNGTHKYNANCCDIFGDCSWAITNETYTIQLDYENPQVQNLAPLAGTNYNLNDVLNITANVTDNRMVSLVQAKLDWNGGSQTYDMELLTGDIYNATFPIQKLGRVNITILAYDQANNLNNSETTWIDVTYTTNAALYCVSSPCVATSAMIERHGGMTPAEANQPNTIDACTDGTQGTWQTDESLDNITMTNLNGTEFRIGDTVQVDIVAYCYDATNDNINFVYTNSTSAIQWNLLNVLDPCPVTGYHTQSHQFVLEGPVGVQAFRGIIAYQGTGTETCAGGNYDDNDDIEFLVQKARESTPPSATLTEPNHTTTYYYSDIIPISAIVTDTSTLEDVYVQIQRGVQNWRVNLTDLDGDDEFTAIFSNTQTTGNYTIQLFAVDEFGNINSSETNWFMVEDTGTLEITTLGCQPNPTNVSVTIHCFANATDTIVPVDTVIANVTYPNGTVESQIILNESTIYNFSLTTDLAGDYEVTWQVNNSNAITRSSIDVFRVNELSKPNVLLIQPISGRNYNTSQNVIIQANVTDNHEVDRVYALVTLPDASTEIENLTKQPNNITYQGSYYLASQFGNYSITIVANDTSGNINDSQSTWVNVSYVSSGALFCYTSPCIVDSSLIASRDSLATPEPNSPNTLDSCTDGGTGTYQSDESLENITMRSLNGSEFRGGDTVEVNITAYCYDNTNDNINFVYANDSTLLQWNVVGTQDPCPQVGFYRASRQFILDKNVGPHAFRGIVAYQGTGTETCAGGEYDDNDDFEFYVDKPRESNPPSVQFIEPTLTTYQVDTDVTIRLNITEETDIEFLRVNVTWPGNLEEISMTHLGNGIYEGLFTNTSTFDTFTIGVYVNDTFGNTNDTQTKQFEIGDAINPIINDVNITPNSTVQGNNITITANVTDDFTVDEVLVLIEGTNYSLTPTIGDLYTFEFNTSMYAAGEYPIIVFANDTNNNLANFTGLNFTVEKRTAEIALYLNGTRNNFSIYPGDSVNISAQLLTPGLGTIIIYNESNSIYSGSSPHENTLIFNTPGNYNITAEYTTTQNYTYDSETFYVIVNSYIPPNITLISPIQDSGDNDGDINFTFNVTGGSLIENCSVIINGAIAQTSSSISLDTTETIEVKGLLPGRYNWSVNCTDPIYTRNSITRNVDVINTTIFQGETTEFDMENTSSIQNLYLEDLTSGSINYTETINLSYGSPLTQIIDIHYNNITVNTQTEPRLNQSAILILKGLPYATTPYIYKNNIYCSEPSCQIISYKPLSGTLTFNVTGFSSYTTNENANLSIWDEADAEGGSQKKYIEEQTTFFANYTNSITGESINGTGVTCEIEFNESGSWSIPKEMNFNTSTLLYQYNRTFSTTETYLYNISCDGVSQGYEPVETQDNITIHYVIIDTTPPSITFIEPTDNDSEVIGRNWTNVSIEVIDLYNTSTYINIDNSLIGYWNFEDVTGTIVQDQSANNLDGTLINGMNIDGNLIKRTRGNYSELDGLTQYMQVGYDSLLDVTEEFTIEAWVYEGIQAEGWAQIANRNGDDGFNLQHNVDNSQFEFAVNTDDGRDYVLATPLGGLQQQNWYHIAAVYDGAWMIIYINGEERARRAHTGIVNTSTSDLFIGARTGGLIDRYFNGSIDEVKYWNKSLTQEEVRLSYSYASIEFSNNYTSLEDGNHTLQACTIDHGGNTACTETRTITVDTVQPQIIIENPTPANNTYTNTSWVYFNITVIEENLNNATLHLNGTNELLTCQGSVSTKNCYLNKTSLITGNYTYNFSVLDKVGQSTITETRHVIVDLLKPIVTIQAPQNNSYHNESNILDLNYTVTDNYLLDTCSYAINEGTYIELPACQNISLSPLTNGIHNITLRVNDSAGNTQTTLHYLEINLSKIDIIPNYPTNITYHNQTTIELNISTNRAVEECNYTLDNSPWLIMTNNTFLEWNATETSLYQGEHEINYTCQDDVGVRENETILFTVDSINPNLVIQTPQQNKQYNSENLSLHYIANDATNLTCRYSLDEGIQQEITDCQNITLTNLLDGIHNVTLEVEDLAGNKNMSFVNFTVDTKLPELTIYSPLQASYNQGNLVLNISLDEQGDVCEYSINSTPNQTLTKLNDTWYTIPETFIDGTYTIAFYCNDSAGNIGTNTTQIMIDLQTPNLIFVSPTEDDTKTIIINTTTINTSIIEVNNHSAFINWNNTLLGYWNFENTSGTTTYDFTNNNEDGVLRSGAQIAWEDNIRGKYLQLNGIDQDVRISNKPAFDVSVNYSVEAWVKEGTQSESWATIFNQNGNSGIRLHHNELNTDFEFAVDGGSWVSAAPPGGIQEGQWYHLVGTYDGHNLRLYIDGVEEDNLAYTGVTPDTGQDLFIGSYAGSTRWFNGSIDEVKFWNRTLTPEEIQYTYNQGLTAMEIDFENLTDGTYTYETCAIDMAGNIGCTETRSITVLTGAGVDLQINNITFNETIIQENKNITIQVNVSNEGELDAINATIELNISFWNGTKTLESRLNTTITTLLANTTNIFNFTWIAPIGTYIFETTVDYENAITETNESNNFFETNTTISAWHIFYGNSDYELFISNAINETLLNWSANSPEATFFYADVDSTFYPFDLQALSQVNDLAEADAALGLTGYLDSIETLYDQDGNGFSDQTIDVEIAGSMVLNIPVINSTNTSSFVTGILFDSADGGVEYNGTQDLVFITLLNPSKTGLYGTYDYEVRLPSTLESQRGVTDLLERIVEVH